MRCWICLIIKRLQLLKFHFYWVLLLGALQMEPSKVWSALVILLSLLKEQLPKSENDNLLVAYKLDDYEAIYNLIDQYQIQDATKELLISMINEAKNCLESISNIGLKLALHEILGKIFKEYI